MNTIVKIGLIIYILIIIQCSITITVLYLKSKKTEKLYSLLLCNITAMAWLFFAFFEKFASGTTYYLLFIRFPLIAIHLLATTSLMFVLFYVGILNHENRKKAIFLFIPNILCFIPYFSNKYFYLIVQKCINNSTVLAWGPVLKVSMAISYIFLGIALVLLLRDMKAEKHYFKSNVLMIVVILLPMTLHFMMEARIIRPTGLDLVPLTFPIVLAIYSVLTFKYKMIDILPRASYEVFNYTTSAVVIIDKEGKIEEYNNAFEAIYKKEVIKGLSTIGNIIETIEKYSSNAEAFAKIKKALTTNANEVSKETLIFKIRDYRKRQYVVNSIPLTTKKGYYIGKVIIGYDITEHRESTLLEERTRLSNDLHDSLGNSINVISSNLEYIMKKMNAQKEEYGELNDINKEIKECVEVSYSKSINAFMDLRRIVDDLYPVDIEKNGIVWALNANFYKLRLKGIMVEFSHSEIDDSIISKNRISGSIYTICQEALNNAVVHGNAKKITVSLVQQKDKVKFYFLDDGRGCKHIIKSRGLASMEKRAKELKGTIEYGSPSAGGFNIKVVIPIQNR